MMDEGVGDEIQEYSKTRNDFKKDFIEKWLLNLSLEYQIRSRQKDFNSNLTKTPESNSASTSLLLGEEEADFRAAKKKVSKLQFLYALKNIFKKKKGEFGSDEIVSVDSPTESTYNILSMDQDEKEIIAKVKDNITANRLNENSLKKPQAENKRDGGTQTQLRESVVRIQAPGASVRNLGTLDKFNRGFSEIIQTKNYYQDNMSEVGSDTLGSTMSDERCATVDRDRQKPNSNDVPIKTMNFHIESKAVGDGWDILPQSEYSSISVKNTTHPHNERHSSARNPNVNQVDSYVTKLELIKTYFEAKSVKGEAPKPKSSMTVIRVPLTTRTSSKTISVVDSCALTKDLTEAPYLREHERLQWQGKNRELWYRINALYQKYKRQHVEEPQKVKMNPINIQKIPSRPIAVAPALEKIYYHSRGMDNRSESYLPCWKSRTDFNRPRKSKPVPFGKTDVKRHVKLEEIFVTEHVRNHRGIRQLSSSPDKRRKKKDYYNAIKRPKTHGWHCTLEQVRASMQRMSNEEIEMVRSATASKDRQRCQSKISVAVSSSDWEEVSTPSLESSSSLNSIRVPKPLPNIPYTPSFKHHFQTRF